MTELNQTIGGNGAIASLNVFFSDPILINQYIFEQWLRGFTVESTTRIVKAKQAQNAVEEKYFYLVQNEIVYQYRIFDQIVKLLADPCMFMAQGSSCEVQIPPSVRRRLIEKYFSYDEAVFRELIGRKLNDRSRKDLDDISEQTGVEMISCRRQYDNLRSVQKFFKDGHMLVNPTMATIYNVVEEKFVLPKRLARHYGVCAFLCHHRLDITKRKLSNFDFSLFRYFAKRMIKYWTKNGSSNQIPVQQLVDTSPSSSTSSGNNSGSFMIPTNTSLLILTLDFYILRDLKAVLYNHKTRLAEFQEMVIARTMGLNIKNERVTRLEERFPILLKNLLNIGAGLIQPKELRDFFIDILEKFVEILKQVPLSEDETKLFCDALIGSFHDLNSLRIHAKSKFLTPWDLFMFVVKDVSVRFVKVM
ncbi:hypothetical protein AKO1_009882 [Acrasis kona]|uniref:Acidic fibroblast growth factor intracellular-binding protein n=1 Tax=Acrasis kona TaxID=1008807 RepID=A0AAW2ZQ24_9EUKA